jgi:hypothetical protein
MVTAGQLHVSASNRPLSGCTHKEKGWGLYNIQCDSFSLYVQPDDGLLEAETCSWLAVTIIRYMYIYTYIYIHINIYIYIEIYIYSCVFTFKRLLFNFVIFTNTTGMSQLEVTKYVLYRVFQKELYNFESV